MILEEETFKKYGYYPRDLKPKSNKKILVKCNECGKIREISKFHDEGLCKSCMQTGENHHLFGKHRSAETKQKISKAQIGKVISDETKKKISKIHKGKHTSQETKDKISKANKGNFHTKVTKEKMSNAHQGHSHSDETKRKIGEAQKGEKSPCWQGGISFEPYCIKFNDGFKERVREYWDRKCVVCNKDEIENGRRLDVHHVNYNKDTCCNDSTPLFVVLCSSCHAKTNHHRGFWKNLFSELIFEKNGKGKCFYTKEEMNNVRTKNLSSSNET